MCEPTSHNRIISLDTPRRQRCYKLGPWHRGPHSLAAEEQPPARTRCASLPATGGSAELAVDEQPPAQFTVEPLPEFIHHRLISSVHMAAHVAFCLRSNI